MIGNTHTANMCAPAYIAFHQNLSKNTIKQRKPLNEMSLSGNYKRPGYSFSCSVRLCASFTLFAAVLRGATIGKIAC